MNFSYDNSLNIFTDASLIKDREGVTTVCPGVIITLNGGILAFDCDLFYDASISYGEMYALSRGIRMAIELNKTHFLSKYRINIFSDSEYAVFSSTKWIQGWYFRGKDDFSLYNTNNKEVPNPELIYNTIKDVIEGGLHINIINVLAHCNPNNVRDMDRFSNYFYKRNYIREKLNIKKLQEMSVFNGMVDDMTRKTMKKIMADENYDINFFKKKKKPGIYWYPNEIDIRTYRKLIN